jgi:hypothetical protein
MDERVWKWLKANKGKVFVSPRKEIFKVKTKDFELLGVVDDIVNIRFARRNHPAMPLYFWMFNRTLEYIHENKDRAVRLGTKLVPPYEFDTVEGQIWRKPDPTGKSSYKAAPHVCDILALAGLIKHVSILKTGTRRRLQGVELLDTK